MIAGVCGGLSETFGIDAILIRIIFIVVTFFGGIGLLAYLILMIVLPRCEKDAVVEIDVTPKEEASRKLTRYNKGKMIAGICSGMERFFGIDVSIVRIIFIVVTLLTSGFGIIVYLVLWLLLPLEY
ncbi:MAG: PspC domain-containing protein [Candidatus Cloacimonetes bacterium]|nr:PspC domain-containing protein [Candidatus Cloacimonadota bacterium]